MGSEMCIRDSPYTSAIRQIALTTLQSSSMIVHVFTLEQKEKPQKKHHVLDSNLRRRGQRDSSLSVHVLRFLHDEILHCYVSIRANIRLGKIDKQRKKHPPQEDDARAVYPGTCRVGKGKQGEARPATSAPRGGPHLDLGNLRRKT